MTYDGAFVARLFQIILINIALSGDNAVVIAMAVRNLSRSQRSKGIVYGSLAAVVVRVVITFFVAQLLNTPWVKLAGGLVILWVALKLFAGEEAEDERSAASNVWEAVKIIVIADISMGVDNMLAVGGASGGSFTLLLIGLGLSIPIVVFAADLIARLMDRYPIIVYIGAAILGRVGGDMIMTDPRVVAWLQPSAFATHTVEAVLAVVVVVAGWLMQRRGATRRARAAERLGEQRAA